MVSGKHPRRPLYSLFVSMRKWRSFLGCKKKTKNTEAKRDKFNLKVELSLNSKQEITH